MRISGPYTWLKLFEDLPLGEYPGFRITGEVLHLVSWKVDNRHFTLAFTRRGSSESFLVWEGSLELLTFREISPSSSTDSSPPRGPS